MQDAKFLFFRGDGYHAYCAEVLIWDAATSPDKRRRAGTLVLRLDGRPKMLLMKRVSSLMGLGENETTGGIARGVKKFLELLDVEYLDDAGDIEFNEIQEFLELRCHAHSMVDLVTRFHLPYDR